MPNLIGQSLGRYHIIEQLGEGGMATVYKAFDTRLERDVAVKIIRVDQFAPAVLERILKRFEREAKALARLTHPNIVHINDYGEHESIPFLIMDYLAGGTLKQRLGQPVPWQDAIRLLLPVARALHFAHEQGIIHRDVKPSNILITLSGEPMLTDFGIAKILGDEATMDLTGTSATVGTPEYMAPEQVTSKTVDRRADIYALGIVFYEMVTGRRPFRADTPMAVLFKQASEPLPRPNLFVPDLPEVVEKVLFKALAKNPDDRYQTMDEFAAAIENLSARQVAQPVEATAIAPPKPQPVQETKPPVLEQDIRSTVQAAPPRQIIEKGPAPVVPPQPEQRLPIQEKAPSKPRRWIGWAIGGGIAGILLIVGAAVGIPYLIKSAGQVPAVSPVPTKQAVPTISPAPTMKPATPVPTLVSPGSGPGGSIPFPSGGRSVTGAWSTEPDNITPYWSQMSQALWIAQLTSAGLGEWDASGNFVPELAQEVPTAANGGISADGLTITWHLKPGLRWSDGVPLTSEDVKFTWQAIMDPNNASLVTYGYDKIASIDTPDDTTVVIHFSELFPAWQTLFAQGPINEGAILPAHLLRGQTQLDKKPFIHWPTVSSGPWVITEWVPGDQITLLPNPLFYKGRPKLDRIVIKFVPDLETALAALQAGDVDWYPEFTESDIRRVAELEPGIHLLTMQDGFFEHYLFNMGVEGTGVGQSDLEGFCPFKDIRVRKAITLGINRQAIMDALLAGRTFIPATQWIDSPWTNTSLRLEAYDPDAAKQLLNEAGYTPGPDGILHGMCNGVDTRLSIDFETTNRQLRIDMALAVQSDLRKIGIEFKPNHMTFTTLFGSYDKGASLATGNFDMAGFATGFFPDPMDGVLMYYACNNVPSKGNPSGTNYYHLCDPYLDRLMAAVDASADPNVRKPALDALQKYIFDQYYVIMMYARINVYAYTDRFLPGPFGGFSDMNWNSEVWDVK